LGSAGALPLSAGTCITLEIRPSQECYPAEFGRSYSNGTSVVNWIRLKNFTLVSRLSSSLKVIGTDTDRSATYYSYQRSITTMGLSRTVSEKWRFQSKIVHFPTPCIWHPAWSWVLVLWVGNQNDGATGPRKKFDDIFSHLDTIRECDRQTDGHRPTAKTALMHSVAR